VVLNFCYPIDIFYKALSIELCMLIVKTLNLERDIQIHEREARVIDVTPLSSDQHVNSVLPSLNRTAIDFVFKFIHRSWKKPV